MRVVEMDEADYEQLVVQSQSSTVYLSSAFLRVLKDVLADSRLTILGLEVRGRFKGGIPCFIKETEDGSVLNSLPFHGSQGGCIFEGEASAEEKAALLTGMTELADSERCVSSTVISSPFSDDSFYSASMRTNYTLDRVAQVLSLPDAPAGVLALFDRKCRNSVRRARTAGVEVEWDASLSALKEVEEGNRRVMEALGAVPSPSSFFEAVSRRFRPGEGFRVYRGRRQDETVGLLLVIYHGQTAEYLVPVVHPESRKYSPMNLMVHEAASDAVASGFKRFSFGGTRPGQSELHHFKESFGAVDHRYHYFTRASPGLERVMAMGEAGVRSRFPWYFVAPFPAASAL